MSEKYIDSRIINKHDTEANWQTHSDFIPLVGEIIVYDRDSTHNYQRVKVGDGVTNVDALPFINENLPIANGDNYGVIKSNDIATIANGVVTNISKANRLENSDGIKTTMINYETQFGLEETFSTTKEDGTSVVYGYSPRVDKTTGNILIKTVTDSGSKFHTLYSDQNKPSANVIQGLDTYLWNFLTSNEFILDCNEPAPVGE